MTEHTAVGGSFGGLHIILASFPDLGSTKPVQATNTAVSAELCYSRSRDERCSFSAEQRYISLASPALSLQATSTHISSLHEHVATPKTLESLKNWSGHGLSNQTGSAGPETAC